VPQPDTAQPFSSSWQNAQPEPFEPPQASPLAATHETTDDRGSDETDKPRRRSTIREKVSFFVEPEAQSDTPTAPRETRVEEPSHSIATRESVQESAASTETSAPRRAGWWSRRFGNGE